MRTTVILAVLLAIVPAAAQYSREFQSPNLGTGAYGGSFGYDVDGDGAPNLWTRSTAGAVTVYNSSLQSWWTVSFPGYEYSYLATPRDVDGDGLVVPVNMDGDPAGEVVFSGGHYTTDGYNGKIRVYDANSRSLEWESSTLTGFNGFSSVDDVDGDGKHEVIISRVDYTSGWGYVEVYGHVGAGLEGEGGYALEERRVVAEPTVFVSNTTVRFELAAATEVRVAVYDESGREVSELVDTRLPAGEYSMSWDGQDGNGAELPAGVYLYRAELGDDVESGRITLVRR